MAVVKLGEDAFHGGFTEDRGAFFDAEAVTVLFHGGQLFVVQVDDLTMGAPERSLAHLYVFRIGNRRVLLFLCQNRLSLDNKQTGRRGCLSPKERHRQLFPIAKISIFNELAYGQRFRSVLTENLITGSRYRIFTVPALETSTSASRGADQI